MDCLRFFVGTVVVVAADAAPVASYHPNRQILLMVAMRTVAVDHGNCHGDLAHNIAADYLVATHGIVAEVDSFDFPAIFSCETNFVMCCINIFEFSQWSNSFQAT